MYKYNVSMCLVYIITKIPQGIILYTYFYLIIHFYIVLNDNITRKIRNTKTENTRSTRKSIRTLSDRLVNGSDIFESIS